MNGEHPNQKRSFWPFIRPKTDVAAVSPLPASSPARKALRDHATHGVDGCGGERSALLVNLLYEEAEAVGRRYLEAVHEVARIYGELLGIHQTLGSFKGASPELMTPRPGFGVRAIPGLVGKNPSMTISAPGLQLHALNGAPINLAISRTDIATAAARWLDFARRADEEAQSHLNPTPRKTP